MLHTDQPSRDSLACDVMEPVRPQVDAWLLKFLSDNHFTRNDFFERRDGTVRLMTRLTRSLAETSPTWAKAVAPIAERVAAELLRSTKRRAKREGVAKPLPTPLTQANRSAGRAPYRRERANKVSKVTKGAPQLCPECGKAVENRKRRFCSAACRRAYTRDVITPRFESSGLAKLAALRAAQRAKWEKLGLDLEAEKERFRRDILPGLEDFSVLEIVKATGFSRQYASLVRRGLYVPHAAHYEALGRLVDCRREVGRYNQ
jgi:hypothetical protein